MLTNCHWKLEGHQKDSNGFQTFRPMKVWIKTEATDSKVIYQKLAQAKLFDPTLHVKSM